MYVNPTGLGQIVRVPRGVRAIRVPRVRRGVGQFSNPTGVLYPQGVNAQGVPYQACLNPSFTTEFVDCLDGSELSGPPWCALPNGMIVSCSNSSAIAATNFVPSGVLPNQPGGGGSPGNLTQTQPYTPAYDTTTTAPTSTGTASAPSATLANTSRPGQSFQVGDSWTLTIKGAPNSAVTDSATQNGTSLGTTPYGSTDANGNFSLSGTFDSSVVGSWSEQWAVGNVNANLLTFSVAASSAGTTGGTSGGTGGGTPTATSPVPATVATASGSCLSVTNMLGFPDVCIGPVGLSTVAAGLVALMIIGSMFGGKH